jgi:hypothetical protein
MYWRIGSAYTRHPDGENKSAFRGIVKQGPAPGLIAFDGKLAVGWCQLTPRSALLEAYPLDASKSPSASGTGYRSTFARAGFKTVGSRTAARPIMRYDL